MAKAISIYVDSIYTESIGLMYRSIGYGLVSLVTGTV